MEKINGSLSKIKAEKQRKSAVVVSVEKGVLQSLPRVQDLLSCVVVVKCVMAPESRVEARLRSRLLYLGEEWKEAFTHLFPQFANIKKKFQYISADFGYNGQSHRLANRRRDHGLAALKSVFLRGFGRQPLAYRKLQSLNGFSFAMSQVLVPCEVSTNACVLFDEHCVTSDFNCCRNESRGFFGHLGLRH